MSSVLCIGSAVVDIAASPVSRHQSWREKQQISDISIHVGGDAVNQSLMLALLGSETELSVAVGPDENGFYLRSMIESRGVGVKYLKEKKELKTGASLVLIDEIGERNIFSIPGAYTIYDKNDCPKLSCPDLAGLKAISLGSLFNLPVFEADGLEEFFAEAKRRGILIFSDLASDTKAHSIEEVRRFLPYMDYFLPSSYDALEMTETAAVQEAAEKYLDLGVKNVIIKCGRDGCYYQNDQVLGTVPAIPVRTVDTTGAGDAMVAMFLHDTLSGYPMEEACRRACAGASYTTLFMGASSEQITREGLLGWIGSHI